MCSTASGAAPPPRPPGGVVAPEEDPAPEDGSDVSGWDVFVACRPLGARELPRVPTPRRGALDPDDDSAAGRSAFGVAFESLESLLSSGAAGSRGTGPIRPVVEDPAGFAVGLPREPLR
jgi:hypothetical protein